jgi:hypothetical protein
MRRLVLVACAAWMALCAPACAGDAVLPDLPGTAVCGDGVVEAGEGCDNGSTGCVDCAVVPGWTCPGNVCAFVCGDGVVGSGPSCSDPRRDTDCDMTGFWAVRETDYTCDSVFDNPQTSSNWYLYEIAQSGSDFRITANLDCGVHVTGSVTVDYTIASLDAVMYENPMDGRGSHGARHGTSAAAEGGCAVTLERWYQIRGVTDAFLPADFSTDPPLSSLPPLPTVSDAINGTTFPAGATDPDGDGFPGIAFQLSGIVSGVRDSVQRVWKQYASLPGTPVVAGSLQLSVPGAFDVQENVLHVSQCGTGCALLTTPAAASTHPVSTTLAFLGKTLGSARVSSVVTGTPGKNVDADLATCANLRLVLPHDPTAPTGTCQP